MKAIIPTGGRGTRMQPITFSANKHFIPVANKPLILYPIQTVAEAGIREIGLTYNPGGLDYIKNILGSGKQWGVKFTYILQEQPIGLANVVQSAEEFLHGEPFVFHLGDNIFVGGIRDIVEYFLAHKPNGLVTMIHHPENRRMGVPYFDKRQRLIKYVEKPLNPPHDFAVPGLYLADSNFFRSFRGKDKILPSPRGEYEIPAPFQWLIDHKYRVDVMEYKGKWLDPGKFDDWITANQYILDQTLQTKIEIDLSKTNKIENRIAIGPGSDIRDSEIRGPVSIGKDVTIKNSYIGPFTSIGDGCVIDASCIENSVLMEGVRVLRVSKTIDTSLIGPHSVITSNSGPNKSNNLFVGEKSQIIL